MKWISVFLSMLAAPGEKSVWGAVVVGVGAVESGILPDNGRGSGARVWVGSMGSVESGTADGA